MFPRKLHAETYMFMRIGGPKKQIGLGMLHSSSRFGEVNIFTSVLRFTCKIRSLKFEGKKINKENANQIRAQDKELKEKKTLIEKW